MPTQFGRLLRTPPRIRDAALLAGLQSQSRDALEKFLQLCNESRSLEEQLPAPPANASYADYDPRLLAHLYVRARVFPALQALAQQGNQETPALPSCSSMTSCLLWQLVQLAEDGASLRELLGRRDAEAELELLRLYNKNRSGNNRIDEPSPKTGYAKYPRVLLALLWVLAGNGEALRALGRQLHLAIPEPPLYEEMSDDLLQQLWKLAADGAALKALWLREGLLPVAQVGSETPEAVLGFLLWHERRIDARDELLHRYKLLGATREEFLQRFKRGNAPWPFDSLDDFAQEVTVKFLELVETWDYLHYPTLENRFFSSVRNLVIDLIRGTAREPRAMDFTETEIPGPAHQPSEAVAMDDPLPPLSQRIIVKAKMGMDLTDEELSWAANQNLGLQGDILPTAERLEAEQARNLAWLRDHPNPTSQQLAECFLWHDPCKFDRALRDWRLRTLVDYLRSLLERLASPHDAEAQQQAKVIQEAMAALLKRSSGGKRRGRVTPGTVPLFAALQEAGARLWHRLGQWPLGDREADDFGMARQNFAVFCEQFPILLKLAACWRLVRWLLRECPAAVGGQLEPLADWLESGQWLSTFPEDDRERCRCLGHELEQGREGFPDHCQGALDLLFLWLKSTQSPGSSEPRLLDLDRVWWLSLGESQVKEMMAQAHQDHWVKVSEIASQLSQNESDFGRMIWSNERERSECLHRLHKSELATRVKLASCRRLVDFLKAKGPLVDDKPMDRLSDLLQEGQWQATMDQVQELARSNGQLQDGKLSALQLLGLWVRSLPEADLPGQAMQDLDRVWSLSHEEEYLGPAELPAYADVLVAAAWTGNWSEVAKKAGRMVCQCPEGGSTAWTAHHEFRNCLQRLSDKRERRK